ncbi:hypothetical protein [Spiroplasma endosymbiont of Atherix ibis]|uniref:hypothetical protein n=1 Tax=Spiroplasma endosymbiont of Atherix ibis TaxID=3066291 RepID=UPI0030D066D7
MSFEKYYPKFAKKLKGKDMNFQIDALFVLTDEELDQFNTILRSLGILRPYKSRADYYSIKCIFPFIFPIITIVPAEFENEKTIGVGNHYEKFFKTNLNKRDILVAMGIFAVGKIREKYFEFKDIEVSEEDKLTYRNFLDVIKATYQYDEEFIKKFSQAIYNIDDGDIINYADEYEFFLKNKYFNDFLDTIPLFREEEIFRDYFSKLLYDIYLVDIKWIYSVRSLNNIVELRQNIFDNYCENTYYSEELINFFNIKFKLNKKMFNYIAPTNQFRRNLNMDKTLIYKDEPKITSIFEKGAVDPKIIRPKEVKTFKTRRR